MDHRPTYEMQNYKTHQDNIEENLGNLGFDNNFLDTICNL